MMGDDASIGVGDVLVSEHPFAGDVCVWARGLLGAS
jgi:hypothetical protein